MIDLDARARRARLGALLATLGFLGGGGPSFAEEPQDMQSRVLQMFGLGGKKSDDPAPAASPPPAAPASAAPPAADTPPSAEEQPNALGLLLEKALSKRRGGGADPKAKGLTDCPDILVDGGRAELRVPPDADSANVRYQLSIARMARECALNGDNITVRVGLQGAAVLGPAGQSGAYSGSLRIALRRKSDDKVFDEKTHRVGATIPAGASRGEFTLLVEDLSAPFVSAKAGDDYEVIVGFVGDAGPPAARPAKRRRGG